MKKIADNFCGYLKVGDDKYTYYVSDNIVTLLPAQSDKRKIYEFFDRICNNILTGIGSNWREYYAWFSSCFFYFV